MYIINFMLLYRLIPIVQANIIVYLYKLRNIHQTYFLIMVEYTNGGLGKFNIINIIYILLKY